MTLPDEYQKSSASMSNYEQHIWMIKLNETQQCLTTDISKPLQATRISENHPDY